MLHLWSDYVLFTAQGNDVVALSSGFSISKTPAPAPPINKPDSYRIESGINPGELLSKVQRAPGGIGYLHQHTTEALLAKDSWSSVPSTRTQCVLTHLQPGTKYYCRVAVMGSRGQLVYSDIISRIAA